MTLGDIWLAWSNFTYVSLMAIFLLWPALYLSDVSLIREYKKNGKLKEISALLTKNRIYLALTFFYLIPLLGRFISMIYNNNYSIPDIIFMILGLYCLDEIAKYYYIKKNQKQERRDGGIAPSFLIPKEHDDKFQMLIFVVSGVVLFLLWVFLILGHDPVTENEMIAGGVVIALLAFGVSFFATEKVRSLRKAHNDKPAFTSSKSGAGFKPTGSKGAGFKPSGKTSSQEKKPPPNDDAFAFKEDKFDDGRFADSRFDTPRHKAKYESAVKATEDPNTNASEAGKFFTFMKQADQGKQKGIKPWSPKN